MLFALVQIVYWISLSTWFGGVLFIAIAAPIIFRTVRENNPILPTILAVNLEGQHGSLLAGTIVGNLITQLVRVELICGGGVLLGLVGQWSLSDLSGQNWLLPMLRSAMFIAAIAIALYAWRGLWPRIQRHRQEYIEHADEPDIANPAKEHFDRLHRESVTLLSLRLALLLGMILFSATVTPRRIEMQLPGATSRIDVGLLSHRSAKMRTDQGRTSREGKLEDACFSCLSLLRLHLSHRCSSVSICG